MFFLCWPPGLLQNVLRSFGQALWDIQKITLTNVVVFFAETHFAQNCFLVKSMLIKIGVVVLWVSTFDSLSSLGYQFGRAADKKRIGRSIVVVRNPAPAYRSPLPPRPLI